MTPVTPDPLPAAVTASGLVVELVDVLQLPASSDALPLTRFNHLTHAGDGSGRLFAADSRGAVYLIANNSLAEMPFLDVATVVGNDLIVAGSQAGIRSLAFHPDYATPGRPGFGKIFTATVETAVSAANHPDTPIFGNPATTLSHHDVLAEWTVDATNPDRIDPNSRREILRIAQPLSGHNMDLVAFNPNAAAGEADYGMLYIAVGDGGNAAGILSDAHGFGQNTQVAMGKILRIDPLAGATASYQVPSDNPFAGNSDVLPEIWAYGLRNPQRFSWDSGGDGKMLIGDIGQFNIEEVNLGQAGANYGWGAREGTFATEPSDETVLYALPADDAQFGFTYPVAQYDHDEGRAIVGGFVYRGAEIPELQGHYVFGDLRTGRIFHVAEENLLPGQQAAIHELTLLRNGVPVTLLELLGNDTRADLRFGLDEAGELYLSTKRDGFLRTLAPADRPGEEVFSFEPAASDFDGNADILLSASGGQLAYLVNRDAVSVTSAGGIIANGTWRDEIAAGDSLRIDFAANAIETVKIEIIRLGAGETATAAVRDSGGVLLGLVAIPGQGNAGSSTFAATIDQGDLDSPGAIASIELSRGGSGSTFVVGHIDATQGGGGPPQPPTAIQVASAGFNENTGFTTTLTANDPDTPAGAIVYGLEADPSGAFEIFGDQLSLLAPLDFESLPPGFADQGNGTATIDLRISANDGDTPAFSQTLAFTLSDLDESPGGGRILAFDPAAADFDGNGDILLSASGGQLAYLGNRDAVSVTDAGGVIPSATWRDEISGGDSLRIDFASNSIDSVDIELKRLGAGESVAAELRDSSGGLLGLVGIPGQGSGASSVFTARIGQGDLDTPGAIASVILGRQNGGSAFVVGTLGAIESGGGSPQPPSAIQVAAADFDENATFTTTLTATDPDTPAGAIAYSLEDDPSGAFEIVGDQLSLLAPLDFEALPPGFADQGNGTATIDLRISANDGDHPAFSQTLAFTLSDIDETPGSGRVFAFDPAAGDFNGNGDILLSAGGGQLAYLGNRDAVSVTDTGGVILNATWRDEISGGDSLRFDFASASIDSVDIELKRLGSGESVTADIRDSAGGLLGQVAIPGQGSGASSVFTARIGQGDLDTGGAIAGVTLSRGSGGSAFVVGAITATESGGALALAATSSPVLRAEDLLQLSDAAGDLLPAALGAATRQSQDIKSAFGLNVFAAADGNSGLPRPEDDPASFGLV